CEARKTPRTVTTWCGCAWAAGPSFSACSSTPINVIIAAGRFTPSEAIARGSPQMTKSNSPVHTHLPLPLPEPLFTRPYQNGITDPMWPESYPGNLDPKSLEKYLKYLIAEGRLKPFDIEIPAKKQLKERYQSDYAGRVARQDFQSALRAD